MTPVKLLVTAALIASFAGCAVQSEHAGHGHGHGHAQAMSNMHDKMRGSMAVASLSPTQGNAVRGLVMFHEMDGHLMAHAQISGLVANSEHGFHLHEQGSCASVDGTSAGGHFNPGRVAHGPQEGEHHAGDMPSLTANADGVINQKIMLMGVTVKDGPTSINGRSVILHAAADDYKTQPTGNSGARIACGVIAVH